MSWFDTLVLGFIAIYLGVLLAAIGIRIAAAFLAQRAVSAEPTTVPGSSVASSAVVAGGLGMDLAQDRAAGHEPAGGRKARTTLSRRSATATGQRIPPAATTSTEDMPASEASERQWGLAGHRRPDRARLRDDPAASSVATADQRS